MNTYALESNTFFPLPSTDADNGTKKTTKKSDLRKQETYFVHFLFHRIDLYREHIVRPLLMDDNWNLFFMFLFALVPLRMVVKQQYTLIT